VLFEKALSFGGKFQNVSPVFVTNHLVYHYKDGNNQDSSSLKQPYA
jgi:hypothetical protein